MRYIEEGQRNAISVMCTNLDIPANDLLTEDVTTHCEFMKVLARAGAGASSFSVVKPKIWTALQLN